MKGTLRFFYDHWFVSYMEENSFSTFGGNTTINERFCSFILLDKESLILHKDDLVEGAEVNFYIQQDVDDIFYKKINHTIFGLKSEYKAIIYIEKTSWNEIYDEYKCSEQDMSDSFIEWLDKNYVIPKKNKL